MSEDKVFAAILAVWVLFSIGAIATSIQWIMIVNSVVIVALFMLVIYFIIYAEED
jgi:hypothetical protein